MLQRRVTELEAQLAEARKDSERFTQPWKERIEERRKYGLMLGALQSVRWQVEEPIRSAIDEIIKEASAQQSTQQ